MTITNTVLYIYYSVLQPFNDRFFDGHLLTLQLVSQHIPIIVMNSVIATMNNIKVTDINKKK